MNHIELFAGCGGLSLGLKSVGANLLLANELSPMAGETFAFNLLNENLSVKSSGKTKWLSSKYKASDLSKRLRENPQEYPPLGLGECDLDKDGDDLEGSLIIGSVVELNKWLSEVSNKKALQKIKQGFGKGNVDLISGGPPCQSFSMAGMREYSNSRNILPSEFAKFVELVQPKFSLLENVTGILHPFAVEGKKVYAWFEVAKAFAQIGMGRSDGSQGYVPLCVHVNAKYVGVAQNRPRFLMLSFRRDVFNKLKSTFNAKEERLLASSEIFFSKIRAGIAVQLEDLVVHDADKDPEIFKDTFLGTLVGTDVFKTISEAIDDLHSSEIGASHYVSSLNKTLGSVLAKREMENHEFRAHRLEVKRRFRIYQILTQVKPEVCWEVEKILIRKESTLSNAAWEALRNKKFYVEQGRAFRKFTDKSELLKFLLEHQTGKHSQKAAIYDEPAPAALSIPDDVCHYHEAADTLRTLTVREMARIQSFPDNFVFRSKATTGGDQRKYEVPQYTQVGNAVPPLLGRVLGKIIAELLERYKRDQPVEEQQGTVVLNDAG